HVFAGRTPGQHDVLRLEVAMHDPVTVRRADRLARLQQQVDRARPLEPATARRERAPQRDAVEQLHDLEDVAGRAVAPVERVRAEQTHDVWVRQAGHDLALALEARDGRARV